MLDKEIGHAVTDNVTNLGLGKSKLQLIIECGYHTGQALVTLETLQTKLKGDKVIL
jgi:hypothetical protein